MKDDETRSDWVEWLTRAGAALGMNETRLRWRLLLTRRRWTDWAANRKTAVTHVFYAHKVCPRCTRVLDGATKSCPHCGSALPSRPVQILSRIGIVSPAFQSVTALLGLAIVLAYARLIFASPGQGILSFDTATLLRFGAHYPPAVWAGQWWRLGTAVFLHIGLWHLGFNLLALVQIGPMVEECFGKGRMLFLYMATGVLANLGSEALGLRVASAGASGALMGLVGAAAAWGHLDASSRGADVRNHMLKWAVYVMIFGWFIGADNGAHVSGLLAGVLAGGLLQRHWSRRKEASRADRALLLAGLLLATAAFLLVMVPPQAPVAEYEARLHGHLDALPALPSDRAPAPREADAP